MSAATVILATDPRSAARLTAGATPLAAWAATRVPLRAACLDLALRRLPRPRATFALGIDRPTYLSVHSATARLAPEGGALIHLARYLAPDATADPRATERELEELADLIQPGWRAEVVLRRFLPNLVVGHALPMAEEHGEAGRPGPEVPGIPGLFVAGDWVGAEGQLIDASLASGVRAGELAAARCAGRATALAA